MRRLHMRTGAGRALASLMALLLCGVACSGGQGGMAERLRARTYPPDFRYIPTERLHSTMGQLASHMTRLEQLLREPDEKRDEIVALLVAMDRSAASLGPGGWPSNHPRVSRNIEAFRGDLAAARRAAALDPPAFQLARTLSDSCTSCHRGSP